MHIFSDAYSSRNSRASAIIARKDPVVYGDGQYAHGVDGVHMESYERDGFMVLKGIFNQEEVHALLAEVKAMSVDPAITTREEAITEPESSAVRSIFKVHELSPLISRVTRDSRIVDIARQVLGSEVYIHQSRVNLKPGFNGKEFYWHSDFETWHVEDGMPAMRALSCSILLTDNNECNGPLMVMPGSHKHFISCVGETPDNHYKESLKKQEYGVPDAVSLQLLAEKGGIRAITGNAGDVVFFDCNTMHGSNGNISPWPRANVFTVFNSVENKLGTPKHGLRPRPNFIAAREPILQVDPAKFMI